MDHAAEMYNLTDDQLYTAIECGEDLTLDDVTTKEGYCPSTWDKIMCWPSVPTQTLVTKPCLPVLYGIHYDTNQNASRYCNESGQWSKTNYSQCTEIPIERQDFTTIYYLGYSLSLVALSVAVFIFLFYRELRCLRNTIHTNLMSTYILVGLIWIITITIQVSYQGHVLLCVFTITLLQYATLTNFFWMFVEGLYLYMLVVETFAVEAIKLRVYLIIGWGAPVPIIMIWFIARCIVKVEVESSDIMLVEHCPWMVPDYSDWIYKCPTICVLATNCVFLVRIMKVLITKLRSANTVEARQYQKYQKATKALLVLIPLLGITYVLTMAFPTDGNTVIYLRDIMLSTQGLLVAVLYCFLNTEVQNTIKHRFEVWSESRNIDISRRRLTNSKDTPYTATESIRQSSEDSAADLLPMYNQISIETNKDPFIEKLARHIAHNSLFEFINRKRESIFSWSSKNFS